MDDKQVENQFLEAEQEEEIEEDDDEVIEELEKNEQFLFYTNSTFAAQSR